MVFSSILFLFGFLPLFLVVYHLVQHKYKNIVLFIFSLVFYAWGAPKFVFLLLASLSANFYIVRQMSKDTFRYRRLMLFLSLLINVGILGYFKYANFFVENINVFLQQIGVASIAWTQIALPIGISFFTFQSITYTIDVYRRQHRPLDNLHDYLLYILMFPQLIAGPIVRFNTVADDIVDRRKNDTIDNKLNGIYLFVVGLSKKVLIANVLGEYVDGVFAASITDANTGVLWLTIVAYSFQIYFDFSGYSDMAIGLGRIIGFNFPENFNNPYISQNITEFWRRWHITLGEWMKDYLYIPLGGNRVKSVYRVYLNLAIVFLISGFWHGANWTFIIWGAWHGLFLILDRLFLVKWLKGIGRFTRIFINYIVVLIGWVFFRADSLSQALVYIKGLFAFNGFAFGDTVDTELMVMLVLAGIFAFSTATMLGTKAQQWLYHDRYTNKAHLFSLVLAIVFLIINVSYITASGFNPFIYFRF